MAGCVDRNTPTGQAAAPLAGQGSGGPTRLLLRDLPRVPLTAGQVVLRGRWGSAPGMFGRRDEASRPGPMALAVDARERILILDQVNRRVARYSAAGRLLGHTPLTGQGAATAEYLLAAGRDDQIVLALEPRPRARYWLHHLGTGGVRASVALDRAINLPTGIFAQRSGGTTDIWVEQRHFWQTRVRDGARQLGRPDPSRPGARVLVQRAGPRLARVSRVTGGRYTSTLLDVQTPATILAIQELAVDRHGALYLALLMGREAATPPYDVSDVQRVMLVSGGRAGRRVIELERGMATDCNRDLVVSPDGVVYQLFSTDRELRVRRWRLADD